MSPEELAERHPRLYHLTDPSNLPGILERGLLPTSTLLKLFEVPAARRRTIERQRRPEGVILTHPVHGTVRISDNLPLSERALEKCLDDGLTPADWLMLLNRRVFFWADPKGLQDLLAARAIRGRERLMLVFDTAGLVRRHWARVELAAINTGSTIRRPAQRGLATFTPAGHHGYRDWARLRGGTDRVKEVTVLGGVPDIAAHLVEQRLVIGGRAGT